MYLVGGAVYYTLVTTGSFAAAGLSASAYALAFTGVGLIGLGLGGGIYLAVKSYWTREEANKEAVNKILVLMNEG